MCIYLVIKTLGFIFPIPAIFAFIFYDITGAKVLLFLLFFVFFNLFIYFFYVKIVLFKAISLNDVLALFLKKILFFSLGLVLVLVLLYLEMDYITTLKSVIATGLLENSFLLAANTNPMSISNLLNSPSSSSPNPSPNPLPPGQGGPSGFNHHHNTSETSDTRGNSRSNPQQSDNPGNTVNTTTSPEALDLITKCRNLGIFLESEVDSILASRRAELAEIPLGGNYKRNVSLAQIGFTRNNTEELLTLQRFAITYKEKYPEFYKVISSYKNQLNANVYAQKMEKALIIFLDYSLINHL